MTDVQLKELKDATGLTEFPKTPNEAEDVLKILDARIERGLNDLSRVNDRTRESIMRDWQPEEKELVLQLLQSRKQKDFVESSSK
jgi:hypothetical protein